MHRSIRNLGFEAVSKNDSEKGTRMDKSNFLKCKILPFTDSTIIRSFSICR